MSTLFMSILHINMVESWPHKQLTAKIQVANEIMMSALSRKPLCSITNWRIIYWHALNRRALSRRPLCVVPITPIAMSLSRKVFLTFICFLMASKTTQANMLVDQQVICHCRKVSLLH